MLFLFCEDVFSDEKTAKWAIKDQRKICNRIDICPFISSLISYFPGGVTRRGCRAHCRPPPPALCVCVNAWRVECLLWHLQFGASCFLPPRWSSLKSPPLQSLSGSSHCHHIPAAAAHPGFVPTDSVSSGWRTACRTLSGQNGRSVVWTRPIVITTLYQCDWWSRRPSGSHSPRRRAAPRCCWNRGHWSDTAAPAPWGSQQKTQKHLPQQQKQNAWTMNECLSSNTPVIFHLK